MADEENKSLVAKSNVNLPATGEGANNVLCQITSDALEAAKGSEPKLISIGGFDFNEVSYQQLKLWSQRIVLNGKIGTDIETVVDCIDKHRKLIAKSFPRDAHLRNWLDKGSFHTVCFPKGVQWLDKTLDLSHTPELYHLSCSNNDLSELDLSETPKLYALNCSENQLSELDLSHTPKLEKLNYSNNNLSELDLSHTPKLEKLFCSNNNLSKLDLSHTSELGELDCSNNNLSELDLSHTPKLEKLFCSNNNLSELDLSETPYLKGLFCDENQLSELDLSHTPVLGTLFCSNNNLSELDLSETPELDVLVCGENQLSELDLSHTPELYHLSCGNNNLSELDLTHTPELYHLSCSNNDLSELDLSETPKLEKLFCWQKLSPEFRLLRHIFGEKIEFLTSIPRSKIVIGISPAKLIDLEWDITRVLASLTTTEESVLQMRFGIGMNTDHISEEVAQHFAITSDTVRQIEARALRKLRHPSRSRKLRGHLVDIVEVNLRQSEENEE